MKHLSMALCCLGFAALAVGLAALRIVGSPMLLMAIVCPVAMAAMLWWHRRETAGPPDEPAPVDQPPDPNLQSSPFELEA